MFLETLTYSEFAGSSTEWKISLSFSPVTLLVGRNATGKTRTLNVINSLAKLLTQKKHLDECCYQVEFREGSARIKYAIEMHKGVVQYEEVRIDNRVMLKRDKKGVGKIYAEEVEDLLSFRVIESEPAVSAKRDLLQHSFLEPLVTWAEETRFYSFATSMGRQHLLVVDAEVGTKPDPADPVQVVGVFRQGLKEYGEEFASTIRKDMSQLGYPNLDIGVGPVPGLKTAPSLRSPVLGIYVHEKDLETETWQTKMSQGMFRALSLIVHARYAEASHTSNCMIVDDIGEGLDFERASSLVKMLSKSASGHAAQLVMATNDRFIMNAVSVECWRGLVREGRVIQVKSQDTDPELFEEFRLSGLSNFDLFATDFLQSKRRH